MVQQIAAAPAAQVRFNGGELVPNHLHRSNFSVFALDVVAVAADGTTRCPYGAVDVVSAEDIVIFANGTRHRLQKNQPLTLKTRADGGVQITFAAEVEKTRFRSPSLQAVIAGTTPGAGAPHFRADGNVYNRLSGREKGFAVNASVMRAKHLLPSSSNSTILWFEDKIAGAFRSLGAQLGEKRPQCPPPLGTQPKEVAPVEDEFPTEEELNPKYGWALCVDPTTGEPNLTPLYAESDRPEDTERVFASFDEVMAFEWDEGRFGSWLDVWNMIKALGKIILEFLRALVDAAFEFLVDLVKRVLGWIGDLMKRAARIFTDFIEWLRDAIGFAGAARLTAVLSHYSESILARAPETLEQLGGQAIEAIFEPAIGYLEDLKKDLEKLPNTTLRTLFESETGKKIDSVVEEGNAYRAPNQMQAHVSDHLYWFVRTQPANLGAPASNLDDLFKHFTEELSRIDRHFRRLAEDVEALHQKSIWDVGAQDIARLLLDAVIALLEACKDALKAVLDLFCGLMAVVRDGLSQVMGNIPFVSGEYERLTGRKLSFGAVGILIFSLPVALVYKAASHQEVMSKEQMDAMLNAPFVWPWAEPPDHLVAAAQTICMDDVTVCTTQLTHMIATWANCLKPDKAYPTFYDVLTDAPAVSCFLLGLTVVGFRFVRSPFNTRTKGQRGPIDTTCNVMLALDALDALVPLITPLRHHYDKSAAHYGRTEEVAIHFILGVIRALIMFGLVVQIALSKDEDYRWLEGLSVFISTIPPLMYFGLLSPVDPAKRNACTGAIVICEAANSFMYLGGVKI